MAKIISFANQKGGVGKTTSTWNIGVVLAEKGFRTLIIDLDSQASLTIFAGLDPYDYDKCIVDMLDAGEFIEDAVVKIRPTLDIITSKIDLAHLEINLVSKMARETILKRVLSKYKDYYDYILLDCPPQLSLLTTNAFVASDYVAITCQASYLSYRGMEHLCSTIEVVKEMFNDDLEILGVIATLYEQRMNDDKDVLNALKEKFNVFSVIPKLVHVKTSIYAGKSVGESHPNNEGAIAYDKAADYIIENVKVN